MRAPYVDLAQVYWGPGTATPGVLKAVISCRLVFQNRIQSTDVRQGFPQAWITTDYPFLVAGGWVIAPPLWTQDMSTADTLVILTRGGATATVLDTETVQPQVGTPYSRARLRMP